MSEPVGDVDTLESVLRSDHAAIRRLLAELHGVGSAELFAQLCADVVRHFVAEEQYLLPAVREHLPGGRERSDAAFAAHRRIEHLLRDLERDEVSGPAIDRALEELGGALDAHVRGQEDDLLPALSARLDRAIQERLGQDVLGAEQLAPTHPRSFVPRSATLSKLTSWLTGLVEKSWDARDADAR